MEFYSQEYGDVLPFPPSRGIPDPGIEPESPASAARAGRFITTAPAGKPQHPINSV